MIGIKNFIKLYKFAFFLFFAFAVIAVVSGRMAFEGTEGGKSKAERSVGSVVNVEDVEIAEDTEDIKDIEGVEEGKIKTKIKIEDVENVSDGEIEETEVEERLSVEMLVGDREYKAGIREGETVYEVMQNLTAMSIEPFYFSAQEYPGLGFFVTEINGLKNNPQTGKYWIYYVDGESAKVGVSNYILKGGERIEWKYETTNL